MRSTFLQGPQAHGQPAVQSARKAADEAGPQHELVADDLGLGWGFLYSVDRILGKPHRGCFSLEDKRGSAS